MATSSSYVRRFMAAAAFALPMVFAANAHAGGLEAGKCYTKSAAEAVLAQEGQKPLFGGDRITDSKPANIFFMNDSGYGYNIEGERSLGIPSQKLCVGSSYKNVHLNGIDNPNVPSWGQNIKNNGTFDVQKAYSNGGRLIFAAQSYSMKDGKEVDGKAITVMAGTNDQLASVLTVDSTGIPGGLFSMRNFNIFPHMNTLLAQAQRQQKASLPPATIVALAPQ
ncbi:MAG: hypothetical protein IAE63_04800 [Alphaproteobacteria bacterium]|nr:hypothetical protein [Alphaproteobacteria bacterium]